MKCDHWLSPRKKQTGTPAPALSCFLFLFPSTSNRRVRGGWGDKTVEATWQRKGGLFNLQGPRHDRGKMWWINLLFHAVLLQLTLFFFFFLSTPASACSSAPTLPHLHQSQLPQSHAEIARPASPSPLSALLRTSPSLLLLLSKCPLRYWWIFAGWNQQQGLIEFPTIRLISCRHTQPPAWMHKMHKSKSMTPPPTTILAKKTQMRVFTDCKSQPLTKSKSKVLTHTCTW